MQLEKILIDENFKSILKQIINPQKINVDGIYYNSQLCKENGLFVAIEGTQTDGKKYIPDAIINGAKIIVCNNVDGMKQEEGITYLLVENSRLALAYLSHLYYNYPAKSLTIIGITGTNGKTTTAELIKSILESANKKVGFIGTTGIFFNNKRIESSHTTPESLELAHILNEMKQQEIEYVVMEVSSHSIVQHRIANINFRIAAFTNLSHEHLDFHKTIEEYAAAKRLLFTSLLPDSIAIMNGDDTYTKYMLSNCSAISKNVSEKNNADYFINNISVSKQNSQFSITTQEQIYNIKTKLTGHFNIQNAALSFAICKELNIGTQEIITGLSTSEGAMGRMQSVIVSTGATAYVDYAHTPDALEKALIQCRNLLDNDTNNNGKLICVFGCGGDRDKTKRPIMGALAKKFADIICITDDNPRTESSQAIIDDILKGINKINHNIQVISNRSDAIKYAVQTSTNHDIILVAGKGHEDYQIIGKEKKYFNDVDELKNSK
jgi:UDP-N-acetylmuramoyl-L-alanyl-D-glutamate--2,6-diaminopimelate ligase